MQDEQTLRRSTLIVTTVTAFMAPFMLSSVNVALPAAQAGRLSDRLEPGLLASAGMGLTALGLAVFVLLDQHMTIWLVAGNLALLGFGLPCFRHPT